VSIKVKFRIWLESERGRIGRRLIKLLEAVEETGSISSAARNLGIPYHIAWRYIKKAEECLGKELIRSKKGGPGGGGSELTEEGKYIVSLYHKIELVFKRLIEDLRIDL